MFRRKTKKRQDYQLSTEVPRVVTATIEWLKEGDRLKTSVGIFRVAGEKQVIDALSRDFEKAVKSKRPVKLAGHSVHTIAGLLKKYLRELEPPVLTYELFDTWLAAIRIQDVGERLQCLGKAVVALPTGCKVLLNKLLPFLRLVASHAESNKMDAKNLAIIFGPSLLRAKQLDLATAIEQNQCAIDLVAALLENYERCFGSQQRQPLSPQLRMRSAVELGSQIKRRDGMAAAACAGVGRDDDDDDDEKENQSSDGSYLPRSQSQPHSDRFKVVRRQRVPLPSVLPSTPESQASQPCVLFSLPSPPSTFRSPAAAMAAATAASSSSRRQSRRDTLRFENELLRAEGRLTTKRIQRSLYAVFSDNEKEEEEEAEEEAVEHDDDQCCLQEARRLSQSIRRLSTMSSYTMASTAATSAGTATATTAVFHSDNDNDNDDDDNDDDDGYENDVRQGYSLIGSLKGVIDDIIQHRNIESLKRRISGLSRDHLETVARTLMATLDTVARHDGLDVAGDSPRPPPKSSSSSSSTTPRDNKAARRESMLEPPVGDVRLERAQSLFADHAVGTSAAGDQVVDLNAFRLFYQTLCTEIGGLVYPDWLWQIDSLFAKILKQPLTYDIVSMHMCWAQFARWWTQPASGSVIAQSSSSSSDATAAATTASSRATIDTNENPVKTIFTHARRSQAGLYLDMRGV
jgi:RhoGAP domain